MSKATTDVTVGITSQIHMELMKLVQAIANRHPDARHNVGKVLVEAFIYDEIEKYAKGLSDKVWDRMEKTGVYEKPLKPGKYEINESPHLVIKASVSEPVKRFSEDELARVLEASEYKIPPHKTKGFVGAAKIPGTCAVRVSIVER